MSTESSSPSRRRFVRIARVGKWAPRFSIRNGVLFQLDITVLFLGVLLALLVSVLGLSLGWLLGAVTIQALGAATPSTLRVMLFSSQTGDD